MAKDSKPIPPAPQRVKATISIRADLRKELRIAAAHDERQMSDLIEEALEAYLAARASKKKG